jgi:nicotinate phosphoribosyltransferase
MKESEPQRRQPAFHTATPEDILAGRITDVYFVRTAEILKARGMDKRVKAEFIVKSLPDGWEWGVLAGIEEAARVLSSLPVNVRALREGTLFYPDHPVLEIEGPYSAFGIYETCLLGLICQASGVATKAARCKRLAGDRKVISFGARRMHPALAPMIERSAFVGGCDGVAVVQSADLIGEEAIGTIPHALIILLGSGADAIRAFDEVIDKKVGRVALVDTFGDEKFESIAAAEAVGNRLAGVRLDTPSSRRGDFPKILREVRWELDLRGYRDVKLYVSGGIDEEQIPGLNEWVDAYGIGTSISNAPVIDFSMDIVEVEGEPLAKRGKMSGSKRLYRCGTCRRDHMVPHSRTVSACECGGAVEEILVPFIREGRILGDLPKPVDIREEVLRQVKLLTERSIKG